MRLFIDCEWNGFKGELISMALVPEDENIGISPLYIELERKEDPIPWVQENVIPYLQSSGVSRELAQRSLALYLSLPIFYPVHIVADWPEDIERFCELLITGPGQRIAIPRITFEVVPGLEPDSSQQHNALEDARAIRTAVQKLEVA